MREPNEHCNGGTGSMGSKYESGGRSEEEIDVEVGPYKVKKRPYKVKNVNSGMRNQKTEVL